MRHQRSQSLRVQLAMLAHVYKLEVMELSQLVALAVVDFAEELYLCLRDIARYSASHHHHSRRLR